MKKMEKLGIALLALTLLTSCGGRKNLVVLLPEPDNTTGRVVIANAAGERVLSEARQATEIPSPDKTPSAPFVMSEAEVQKTFGPALAVLPPPPLYFTLYFETGALKLTSESERLLATIPQAVAGRSATEVRVVGHTDRVGDDKANFRLALERAEIVKGFLISEGIASERIEVTSHGEANPVVPTADEVPEPRNRRVEVVVP